MVHGLEHSYIIYYIRIYLRYTENVLELKAVHHKTVVHDVYILYTLGIPVGLVEVVGKRL